MRKDQQHTDAAESTIFSQHKSSVEIAQEKREQRKREQEQKKEARSSRAKGTKATYGTRVTVIALCVIVVVILVGVALMIRTNTQNYNRQEATGSAHFYSDEEPELSEEGIKGVITEAYYTNDGSLALKLKFSNGLDANHRLTSLEVVLQNEDEETIATGYTDAIDQAYYIAPKSYNDFTFYIEAKYVKISDDDLDELSYEVTTTGEVETDE